jgi:CHAD domain-containing protein
MLLKFDTLRKSIAELRQSVKHFPKRSTPEVVHHLRKQISLLEAFAPTLLGDDISDAQQVLKPLHLVRCAAGRVRDLDVFIGLTRQLPYNNEPESLERLTAHLHRRRTKAAEKLCDAVGKRQKDCIGCLKEYAKRIENLRTLSNAASPNNTTAAIDPKTSVQSISSELRNWPQLSTDSIHSYRTRVRRLRYLLQLIVGSDPKFVDRLGEVKDAIGDWYDWNELTAIAEDLLDPANRLLAHIRLTTTEKFEEAILRVKALQSDQLQENPLTTTDWQATPKQTDDPLERKPVSSSRPDYRSQRHSL